jgi:predicted amidophosphoribosyltransferase
MRIRSTEAQFGLSIADRQQNLADAFAIHPAFARRPPTRVLLLDDIYTTGATVRAAATCLQRQGISVEGVVVLARPSIAQRPEGH